MRLTVRVVTAGARILTFRISYMSAAADTDGSGFKSQEAHHLVGNSCLVDAEQQDHFRGGTEVKQLLDVWPS